MREGKPGGGKGPLIAENESLTLSQGNGQTLFASSVRRLTPVECERIQGFPDGWTIPLRAASTRPATASSAMPSQSRSSNGSGDGSRR